MIDSPEWLNELQEAVPEWDRSQPPIQPSPHAALWLYSRAASLAPVIVGGPHDGKRNIQANHLAQAFREAHTHGLIESLSGALNFFAWVSVWSSLSQGGDAGQ